MHSLEKSLWAEFHVGFIRDSPDLVITSPPMFGKLGDIYIRTNPHMKESQLCTLQQETVGHHSGKG